ncbi:Translation factor, SUA5 family [Leptospira biflexa serovar Patoc strain 'Patoc 1 (Ames)']|uniref:L-threonylcarbamoyladenylate synthase n=1 Tax=Leptospira biflexa TaxID=172 RepID=UPI000165A21A|nr:L-threonylcarbamoyladenylate synthase [Leptospira biflexa]ABZ94293.1 Translation factor, SUA5 family [Leptospira biflexa serovar Patoc strain 'Patoc 1 (Ames)']
MKTLISSDVRLLADLIRKGGVVVFPTETVFGIGAASDNEDACLRIYQIKGRPSDNPLIAHFSSIDAIKKVCYVNEVANQLLCEFSPGPFTLVLPKTDPKIFPKQLPTLAVRIPKNPVIREWIEACGSPISAPSANLSGRPSLTRMTDVVRYFDGIVDGILIAEEPNLGIESTVLGLTTEVPVLLRPGSIESQALRRFLPNLVIPNEIKSKDSKSEDSKTNQSFVPLSPGMKYKHYAPNAKVVLLETEIFLSTFSKQGMDPKFAWIGFSFGSKTLPEVLGGNRVLCVANNIDYMAKLYAFFESCDLEGYNRIYCEMPREEEGREGLLNRLEKAAATSFE